LKKPNCKKKPIKILKKPTSSVWFYKPKTEKTELNRTQTGKKQEKTKPNRAKSEKTEPNRNNRVKPVFVLKNRIELKLINLY